MEHLAGRDDLGDRMKGYERIETERRLDPALPIYARIDGRGFSRFTRDMRRPFDERFSEVMVATTRHLVSHTNARIGYTQSDEISLVWALDEDAPGQAFFDAKVQKLASILGGLATACFNTTLVLHQDREFAARHAKMPHFDARVFNLPDRSEAVNALIWRELDARRNAVSMAAHAHFAHGDLQGVSRDGMLEMLAGTGVDFADYPSAFRVGTYLRRVAVQRCLTPEERAAIPEAHRPAADAVVVRSEVATLAAPSLLEVANRLEVVFDGAVPEPRRLVSHDRGSDMESMSPP